MTTRAAPTKSSGAFGDGPGPMARRGGTALQVPPETERNLMRVFVIVSAVVHAIVIFATGWQMAHKKITLDDEGEIAADLVSDLDATAPSVTALPNAAPAPEAKVPVNLLPQLTKNFTVVEPKKTEEAVAVEKVEKPPVEATVAPEEKKADPAPVDKKEDQQTNKLTMKDALKRLAMDKLRLDQKTAKQLEAPSKDPLAQLADAMAKKGSLNKGPGNALNGSRAKKYFGLLRAAIRANYSLPEVYKARSATWKVLIGVTVGENGEILKLEIEQSSGDPAFDSLTLEAVKSSVPLPKPPPDLVGETIELNMTP